MLRIHIASEFSDAPGARYRKDGEKSGEEFFEVLLRPRFADALAQWKKLTVDLDVTFGYPSSFLSEAFGRLFKEFGGKKIWDTLVLKSEEDASLPNLIKSLLKDYE